jgi:enamine deaminase RidA (YjgF/YER057c/UK114 family)
MPRAPGGHYVSWLVNGNHLYISGQVSVDGNTGITGVVGRDIDLAQGVAAARLCGINLIRQIWAALDGKVERVQRILRLTGYVQAGDDFVKIPQVMNGCSDLLVEIFGEKGRHTRSSVGVKKLPRNCAVEVDAIVAID